jgi:hypothetical protein
MPTPHFQFAASAIHFRRMRAVMPDAASEDHAPMSDGGARLLPVRAAPCLPLPDGANILFFPALLAA